MLHEDVSLLLTNYVPGVRETSVIRARIEAQSADMQSLDERITSLEFDILEIRKERVRLATSRAVGEALLAPMRKLPVEIMEEIFVEWMPEFLLDDMERNMSHHPLPCSEHPHFVRSRLLSVCRRWRIIADSAPRVCRR